MGVEGCRMKCVKYLIFIFNLIVWLCGLALVALGIAVQVLLHNTYKINDPSASGAPITLIVVGVVIFFVSFFGCCGAFKENYCMLTTFTILLSLLIIVEIAAAIVGYIFRNKLSAIVQDNLTYMMTNYSKRGSEFQAAVDQLQQSMKCCGGNSTADWTHFASDGKSVPDSCCVTVTKGCGAGTMQDAALVFQTGCATAVEASLKTNILWVIAAAFVIAVLQLLGVVSACILMKAIRSGYVVMWSTPE